LKKIKIEMDEPNEIDNNFDPINPEVIESSKVTNLII
jgi:hypothetical protein